MIKLCVNMKVRQVKMGRNVNVAFFQSLVYALTHNAKSNKIR